MVKCAYQNNSLVYGKNREPTPVSWPRWNDQEFNKILAHYRKYLNMVYTEEDCKATALADRKAPSLPQGLYSLDDELKGLTENLSEVSDSSDDDVVLEDKGHVRKKGKHGWKSGKPKKVVAKSKAKVTKATEGNTDEENGEEQWKLCDYERTRLENIRRIQTDPAMMQLNEEIRQIREQRHPPHPKPKPRVKKIPEAPSRRSGRLSVGGTDSEEMLDVQTTYSVPLSPPAPQLIGADLMGNVDMDIDQGDVDIDMTMLVSTSEDLHAATHTDDSSMGTGSACLPSSASASDCAAMASPTGNGATNHDADSPPNPSIITTPVLEMFDVFMDAQHPTGMPALEISSTEDDMHAKAMIGAPDWFTAPYAAFTAGGLGSKYRDFLIAFTALEAKLGVQARVYRFAAER